MQVNTGSPVLSDGITSVSVGVRGSRGIYLHPWEASLR
jgi:hypothetical protein